MKEDIGHGSVVNFSVKKISRTEETYEGVVVISNGLQIIGVIDEIFNIKCIRIRKSDVKYKIIIILGQN